MLLHQFQEHLKQNFPHLSPVNCQLLLAVSGGIDSIVMTDLFYKSGFDFTIAHCNFQLRGDESNGDETFVKSIASKYNKEIFVKRFETNHYTEKTKISIQEAARELRYEWFAEIVISKLPTANYQQFIVTAHHADDNIETLLLFFFRGTGLHGLTGIKSIDKKRKIIHSLLFATREEITKYAIENNLSWVEDSSNTSNKYTRNFFRNNLIPEITKHFVNVKDNLTQNIKRFNEANELYQQAISSHKKKLLQLKGSEIHIPLLKLLKAKPLNTIIWEIIKDFNFNSNQVDEIKKLFNAENSSYFSSSSHRIIKNRNWLIITPNKTNEADLILIEESNNQINFENGIIKLEKLSAVNYQLSNVNSIAQLDAKHIEFPLLLRKWKQGDYFYPLGMRKKKKLSRFFIDQKLSATDKENTWLIESNRKIIWIINHRIDDRYKISAGSTIMLKIIYNAH